MVDATTATAASSVASKLASSKGRLADSEETFLKLLTTQLKNQDPLSPLDSNQFTQQIVQMTGVEQQLMTNDLLAKLIGLSDGGLSGSVGLIGKQIKAASDSATLADGKASWSYDLAGAAQDATISIVNSAGQTVYSETASNLASGSHDFTWNGKTTDGRTLPDGGTYTVKIAAKSATGSTVAVTPYVSGVATGVETLDGATVVSLGKTKIPVSQIVSVTNLS
ncbi:flagellar basal-body rod modification protein FlgD [Caulobacter ginsengisoli]|uniref:Basal-body rod modification protein FlgD n=1 Tax=Caulobacter ginsengisoli TaxID=400775 RepID=A0ABU0IQN7_9CAUL|nr:flagellar hook assembly protein FlgD [Caulobacter ginsengisoli]MDQ0463334.1 flagellar basal-body rod modification protein FlgD [Caulobacter ginsengisoli]